MKLTNIIDLLREIINNSSTHTGVDIAQQGKEGGARAMTNRKSRKNQRQFKVVARGVRRVDPDFSRLATAALTRFHDKTATESTIPTDSDKENRS